MDGAQLQGASLAGAQLQAASLAGAQLQGASLEGAILEVTDLFDAYLWRTNEPDTVAAIRMSGDRTWLPEWVDERRNVRPWDDEAYRALRATIVSLPPGTLRDAALERIRYLDCSNYDKTLASCDPPWAWVPPLPPPPVAASWRKRLEAAAVDDKTYAEALAKTLKALVCSGDGEAIYILRGLLFQDGPRRAGDAATELIGDLLNKNSTDCPVAASLTDDDRAKLLLTKQSIEATSSPGG